MPAATAAERTLVLVKPDAVRRGLSGEVLRRIEAKGYTLVAVELRVADTALLTAHYAEHEGKPFFGPLLEFMSSGPVLAVVAEGQRVDRGLPFVGRHHRPDACRARHDPRRPRAGLGHRRRAEPRARLRLAGVGAPGDRPVVPGSVTRTS